MILHIAKGSASFFGVSRRLFVPLDGQTPDICTWPKFSPQINIWVTPPNPSPSPAPIFLSHGFRATINRHSFQQQVSLGVFGVCPLWRRRQANPARTPPPPNGWCPMPPRVWEALLWGEDMSRPDLAMVPKFVFGRNIKRMQKCGLAITCDIIENLAISPGFPGF